MENAGRGAAGAHRGARCPTSACRGAAPASPSCAARAATAATASSWPAGSSGPATASTCWLLARPDELRGDAAAMLARGPGARDPTADRRGRRQRSRAALAGADLVVDALLGTGARGEPAPLDRARHRGDQRERTARWSRSTSRRGCPPTASRRAGPAVRAALTTTFAGLKRGLVDRPGGGAGRPRRRGGHRRAGRRGRARRLRRSCSSPSDVARHFPPRPREAHKGRLRPSAARGRLARQDGRRRARRARGDARRRGAGDRGDRRQRAARRRRV